MCISIKRQVTMMQNNALNNPMNDDMTNSDSFLFNVSGWFNDERLELVGEDGTEDGGDDGTEDDGDDGTEDNGDDRAEDECRESGRSDFLVVVIFLSNFFADSSYRFFRTSSSFSCLVTLAVDH